MNEFARFEKKDDDVDGGGGGSCSAAVAQIAGGLLRCLSQSGRPTSFIEQIPQFKDVHLGPP